MKTRTTYSAEFKAKLALEVIKGNRTLAEIASEAQVHPNLLTQWKRQLLESLPTVFSGKRAKSVLKKCYFANLRTMMWIMAM